MVVMERDVRDMKRIERDKKGRRKRIPDIAARMLGGRNRRI